MLRSVYTRPKSIIQARRIPKIIESLEPEDIERRDKRIVTVPSIDVIGDTYWVSSEDIVVGYKTIETISATILAIVAEDDEFGDITVAPLFAKILDHKNNWRHRAGFELYSLQRSELVDVATRLVLTANVALEITNPQYQIPLLDETV